MVAKYIIRLDDACATSDLSKWNAVEEVLDEFGVKPIVAVVPDNKDKELIYQNENQSFWEMVKGWEAKGWSIAMHGYQHTFHQVDRRRLVFPFYDRSEFGGLSIEKQRDKIRKSLRIFQNNGVKPSLWVAPAHSFDETTLDALAEEVEFRVVSDGIAFYPYAYKGFFFVPQQLWRIKKKKFGIWTVCLHPDTMTDKDIQTLKSGLSLGFIVDNLISLQDVKLDNNAKGIFGKLYSMCFWARYWLASFVKGLK